MDAEALARQCVHVCEDRKARDVLLYDARKSSVLADFYIICSGGSEPQIRAIANHLTQDLAKAGFHPRVEGRTVSRWVILDYGVVLIHIMEQELRSFYRIEELWNATDLIYRSPETL